MEIERTEEVPAALNRASQSEMGKIAMANVTQRSLDETSFVVAKGLLDTLSGEGAVHYLAFLRAMEDRGFGVDFANRSLLQIGLMPDSQAILVQR